MPTPIHIPNIQTKTWSGIFEGIFDGTIWKSFNIDLEKSVNKLLLAKRFKELQNSGDDTDVGTVNKFLPSNASNSTRYYAAVRYGKLLRTANSDPMGTYAADATTDAPTQCFDMVNFESYGGYDRLVVSVNGDIVIQNLNANHANAWKKNFWTAVDIASSTNATPIEITTNTNHYLETGDTVVVTNHLVNTNANGNWVITKVSATKFTLTGSVGNGVGGATGTCGYLNQPAMSGYVSLDVYNRTLLIGNTNYLHVIDKNDKVSYQRLIFPKNRKVIKIIHTNNRVWIITINTDNTKEGAIYEWDGFSQNYLYEHTLNEYPLSGCTHLPSNEPYIITYLGSIMRGIPGQGFSEVKRLPVYEDSLKMVSNGGATQTPNAMLQYSMASDGREILFAFNPYDGYTGAEIITQRLPAGIWAFNPKNGNLYHKYSFSRYNGTTNYDYGQPTVIDVGAILPINADNDVIASAKFWRSYISSQNAVWGIFTAEPNYTSGRGHFVTPLIPTTQAEEIWSKVWIKFRKFMGSTNTIVIKARSSYGYGLATTSAPLTASAVWVTGTTFNSVVPTGVVVGDEVEILAGRSAGCTFHITTLSAVPNGVATITVTIDETAPNFDATTDKGILVRYENFVKCGIIDYNTSFPNITYKDVGLDKQDAPYLQLKIELRGPFAEIDELIVEHKTNQVIDQTQAS
ncbi:hypothetical protein M0R04_09980 [Candidatus Dojkabacteria bacterium]|jgi:hypothetical protein|nr:hypothetical protein [Candidatus Dojkabacteria bacterium]